MGLYKFKPAPFPEDWTSPNGQISLMFGDCLKRMSEIEDHSIDMILADLPYGTTQCHWDSVIPLEPLWEHYKRLIKYRGAIVLTASQPFTSILVCSNLDWFRHEWIWVKNSGSNFGNTVREPMKEHESILVFSKGNWIFNKQLEIRATAGKQRQNYRFNQTTDTKAYGEFTNPPTNGRELRVPSSCQEFNISKGYSHIQATQKPVPLFEYLIKTYSNEGNWILDNTVGSGTTLVACLNTNRNGIGIEKGRKEYRQALERLKAYEVP